MARLNLIFSAFGTALLSMTLAACGETSTTPAPPAPDNVGAGGSTGAGTGTGTGNTGVGGGGGGYVISTGGSTSVTCSGTNTVGCKAQAAEGCGDGINNQGGIEVCDDGNTVPGDGCNGACKVERNWDCPKDISVGPCTRQVICGDGTIGAGEVCDDKNTIDNDGCNSTCTAQDAAYTCVAGEACVRVSQCGNTRIESGENCDDGQATPTSGDGCSASCQLEAGWVCPKPGQPCKAAPSCGDGIVSAALNEVCDDGNSKDGDGCSGNCKVKGEGCVCTPGSLCKCPTVACGNGTVEGAEACDDGNSKAEDGCNADCTAVESGYSCPFSGAPCVPKCGDGIVLAPMEQCDPGVQATNMDQACSSTCKWNVGWACSTGGTVTCHQTKCGDGNKEGSEGCDDGNTAPGDGCSPTCHAEPSCSAATGKCESVCGDGTVVPVQPDGAVMPGGACDDGNASGGDGCSADCKVEPGYQCEQPSQSAPTMTVPMVVRDFKFGGDFEPSATGKFVAVTGMVKTTLDSEGKPDFSGTTNTDAYVTSAASFGNWYRDVSGTNSTFETTLTLYDNGNGGYVNRYGANGEKWQTLSGNTQHWCGTTDQPDHDASGKAIPCTFCPYDADTSTPQCTAMVDGAPVEKPQDTDCQTIPNMLKCVVEGNTYHGIWLEAEYDGTPVFFPLDGVANMITPTSEYYTAKISPAYGGTWENETGEPQHNFSFTTEVRYFFGYVKGKTYTLDFQGDDDVWVFVNRKLAVDLGGIHTPVNATLVLDASGTGTGTLTITPTEGTITSVKSNVNLGLTSGEVYEIAIFQAERQTTASTYKLTLSGFNDQPSQCKAICGDGVVSPGEQCDNGADNIGGYNKCTADCLLGPFCGDAVVDPDNEACDNGKNDSDRGSDNGCSPGCKLPSSCGDGLVQTDWGEDCDNGASNVAPNADGSAPYGGDICTTSCLAGGYCGDGTLNGPETCDDGANDGTYGTCNPDCTPAPKCGDGNVDDSYGEECEPTMSDDPSCTQGCRFPGGCGDGKIQSPEQCDEGELFNLGDYGGCAPSCIYAPRCGDGVKNGPEAQLDADGKVLVPAAEECDAGDPSNPELGGGDGSYGGCTKQCRLGPHCGDGITSEADGETCDHGAQNGKDDLCTIACKIITYVPG